MNRSKRVAAVSVMIASLVSLGAEADYTLDWHKVGGGGGTSTSGVYTVSGTLGQPDAGGPMTNGKFSVTGGFWSLLSVVPTEGAPLLTITLTTTNTALVAWPSPSVGWTLQQNPSLATTNWVTPSESITDNGTRKFILVNPQVDQRFYRLVK